MCEQAEAAVRDGKLVLLLSDRYLVQREAPDARAARDRRGPPPSGRARACAASATCSIETGTARDPHHFACLIGYGATAVYPYMAYQTLFDMMRKGRVKLDFADAHGARPQLPRRHPQGPVQDHVEDGHLDDRELSQLRSCSRSSACTTKWCDLCFTGTESRIQGADFDDLEEDQQARSPRARGTRVQPVEQGGLLKYVHGGEYHMYNPDVIATLQAAVISGDYEHYQQFAAAGERAAGVDVARPAEARAPARSRFRSKKWSRSRRSSRASTARACRSARCRPKRTRRWPSR